MEMDCYFTYVLDTKFNKENIFKILQAGKAMDFIYFNSRIKKAITIEEALNVVINQDLEANEMIFLNIKMQDIWLSTFFYETSENLVKIAIFSDGPVWITEGLLTKNIYPDLIRYIKELNQFLKLFNIIKFQLEGMDLS